MSAPTKKELVKVIAELGAIIDTMQSTYQNDRNPYRADHMVKLWEKGNALKEKTINLFPQGWAR